MKKQAVGRKLKRKYKRLYFVAIGLVLLGLATGLILNALEKNIVLFLSPSQVVETPPASGKTFRLGGVVERGSLIKGENAQVEFRVSDGTTSILVVYKGILPDLFREKQGVVADGKLVDRIFQADEILAKHDENYMPPEVAETIKKMGQWKGQK